MAEAAANFGKALESLASLPNGSQRRSSELALRLELAGTLTAVKTNLFDVSTYWTGSVGSKRAC
jgi:hypothetical protein